MSNLATRFCSFLLLTALFLVTGYAQADAATAAPAPDRGNVRLLVLPFQVTGTDDDDALGHSYAELMAQRLAAKGLQVIPYETMLTLVESKKISSLDISTVRSLAIAAKATHAVYGSVTKIGNAAGVDARLVGASNAFATRPLFVEQRLDNESVLSSAEELSGRVAGQFLQRDALAGVEVRGTKVLDPEVVLMRIGTRKGDVLDPSLIDSEVKKIWDLGYFSDVQVNVEQRGDGPVLVYTVTEKPRLEAINVEGAEEIDSEDITSVMSNKVGSILNEKFLADDIQKILELYRKDGFYLATVDTGTDLQPDRATAVLNLTINEGKRLYIKQVNIEGVEKLSESSVKDELLLSERSFISWITGTGVLKEELIERDASAISSYYLERGFMDIAVGAPKIDYEEDGIAVTFPIKEGPRYTLHEVSFAGELIDTDARLRALTTTDTMAEEGDYFSLSAMQADAKRLTDFYADYGYAFADVNPVPKKLESNEESGSVDIIYQIEKKSKVYVRNVIMEGNMKTRDNVILREMRLTDGEPFEGGRLRRSTERLNKLGYFEVAEAELVPTTNDDEVDLKITVKERPTGAIMAGVGYSTFSSVGVTATLMERNLWGKGYSTALQASFSGMRDAYTWRFANPRLYDTDLSFGWDLYHWRDDYIDYVKRTTGGILRFGYPIGEYTSVGWGYRLDRYKIYDLDADVSRIIRRYADGTRYTSSGLAHVIRDTTNREHPTSGTINYFGVEYGGGALGGDDDFITVTAEHHTYYELMKDHVLHARLKGAAIFNNGSDEVPVFERFWMGGMETVRGYSMRNIVPRDPLTGDRIGGNRMAFANFEYIYELFNEAGIALVPFFDVGFNLDTDQEYNFSDEILKSFGLEVRWRSPMGDLRFSYGIPLDKDRRGKRDSGRFEFSMGQMF